MCFHEQQRPFQGNFDGIDERMGEQSKTDRQEPLRRLCQTSLELLYALDSERNLLAQQLPSQLLQLCKSGTFLSVKPKSMAKLLVITGAGADDHPELAPFPSADVALVRVVLHLANTPVHGMRRTPRNRRGRVRGTSRAARQRHRRPLSGQRCSGSARMGARRGRPQAPPRSGRRAWRRRRTSRSGGALARSAVCSYSAQARWDKTSAWALRSCSVRFGCCCQSTACRWKTDRACCCRACGVSLSMRAQAKQHGAARSTVAEKPRWSRLLGLSCAAGTQPHGHGPSAAARPPRRRTRRTSDWGAKAPSRRLSRTAAATRTWRCCSPCSTWCFCRCRSECSRLH